LASFAKEPFFVFSSTLKRKPLPEMDGGVLLRYMVEKSPNSELCRASLIEFYRVSMVYMYPAIIEVDLVDIKTCYVRYNAYFKRITIVLI
jgi:hypothetical protein